MSATRPLDGQSACPLYPSSTQITARLENSGRHQNCTEREMWEVTSLAGAIPAVLVGWFTLGLMAVTWKVLRS